MSEIKTMPVKVRLHGTILNGAPKFVAAVEGESCYEDNGPYWHLVSETTVHVPVNAPEPKFKVGQRVRVRNAGKGTVAARHRPDWLVYVQMDNGGMAGCHDDVLIPLKKVKYKVYRGKSHHLYAFREDAPWDERCASDGGLLLHSFELEEEDGDE